MADRQRIRVGRDVSYFPTDAEASAGGGEAGDTWFARIAKVNADGSVNLNVIQGDGSELALTDIARGQRKGTFGLRGGITHHA
jgi:hypothetical protein